MVEPARLAVALTGGIDEGEVPGLADIREQLILAGKVEFLERDRDLLGEADADEAAGRDRVAAADQPTASGAETTLPSRDCTTVGRFPGT